jgi:hypothetical protein
MRKTVCLFSLFMLITACDRGGDYHYYISNNSSYTISIEYIVSNGQYINDLIDSSIVVFPSSDKIIFEYRSPTIGSDKGNRFLEPFDTISIQILCDTMRIEKDFYNRKSWKYRNDGAFSLNSIEYTFALSDEDFFHVKK